MLDHEFLADMTHHLLVLQDKQHNKAKLYVYTNERKSKLNFLFSGLWRTLQSFNFKEFDSNLTQPLTMAIESVAGLQLELCDLQ